jgi:hypothetical protein
MTQRAQARLLMPLAIAIIVNMAAAHSPHEPAEFGLIERLDPRFDHVVAPDAVLERVAEGIEWAEGPLWDPRAGALLFSDIRRSRACVRHWSRRDSRLRA